LGLLQGRRDWSGPELADRLEVTSRTVRRDVERLRELGYPVEAQIGSLGGYRLGRGSTLPPLLLDDDECLSPVVALRAVALTGLGGVQEGALGVLAKLDPVLANRSRRRARSLAEAVSTPTARGPQLDPEVLTAVAAAVRDTRELRADTLPTTARPRDLATSRPRDLATSRRRDVAWSHTASSTREPAGTCWPSTSTGTTGGSSGWTASPRDSPTGRRSHPARC